MNNTIILKQVLLSLICLFFVGCETNSKSTELAKPSVEEKKENETQNQQTKETGKKFYLRIAFFNDTKTRPIDSNCRMWIRGFGDFYPSRMSGWKYGGTVIEKAGPFYASGENIVYFYPDYSDESKEIKIPFKYTSEMNPNGSVRDMIHIEIKPEKIVFWGIPLKNAHSEGTFDRQNCKKIK